MYTYMRFSRAKECQSCTGPFEETKTKTKTKQKQKQKHLTQHASSTTDETCDATAFCSPGRTCDTRAFPVISFNCPPLLG